LKKKPKGLTFKIKAHKKQVSVIPSTRNSESFCSGYAPEDNNTEISAKEKESERKDISKILNEI
jgi:hypothetical protein